MDACEIKSDEELYVFQYTWIIKNFAEKNDNAELVEQLQDGFKTWSRVDSTKFPSHNGNYEWCLGFFEYTEDIGDGSYRYRNYYLEITCKKFAKFFREKKAELVIDSPKSFRVDVKGYLSSLDNRSTTVQFRYPSQEPGSWNDMHRNDFTRYKQDAYVYLNRKELVRDYLTNDKGELTLVFKLTEPLSAALDARKDDDFIDDFVRVDYEKLFKSGEHSDFKILVGEREFPVHKNILSARSEYFAAMFKHGTKEQARNMVEVSDVRPEVMSSVLQYIYCGKVNMAKELVYDLLTAADMYQMNNLKDKCEKCIINYMTASDIGQCMVYADRYNNECLKDAVISFLMERASEFDEDDVDLLRAYMAAISSSFMNTLAASPLFITETN